MPNAAWRSARRSSPASACVAACLALLLVQPAAFAAEAGRPDLSGFWNAGGGRGGGARMDALLSRIAPGTVMLDDTGAQEFSAGEFGGLDVKPHAAELARQWEPMMDQQVATVCVPPSIIYSMQGPFPIEIFQGTELMIIKLEYFDHVRVVFLDGREHPDAGFPHSKQGHSIGRWDGDILEVDTTHLAASTLANNGLNHSDDVHLIERFRLTDDGRFLHVTQEFEDSEVLNNRGARYMVFARGNDHVYPYECDPSYAVDLEVRER